MAEKKRFTDTDELVVQLSSHGGAGERNELQNYSSLLGMLEERFTQTELGKVGGADAGPDKYNIYVCKIKPSDWDQALALVLKELEQHQLSASAIVAHCITWENDINEWDEYDVVWPLNYKDSFSIW